MLPFVCVSVLLYCAISPSPFSVVMISLSSQNCNVRVFEKCSLSHFHNLINRQFSVHTSVYPNVAQTFLFCFVSWYKSALDMQQLFVHVCVFHSFISIQPWRPGLAGTRAQSCDRYGSGTLHPGQVLGGSLPLHSPAFRRSHFSRQVPLSAKTWHPNLLHAANLHHGTDGFTSPPKEGVLRIFFTLKIERLQPGLNPQTWVLKASTLPLGHRFILQ